MKSNVIGVGIVRKWLTKLARKKRTISKRTRNFTELETKKVKISWTHNTWHCTCNAFLLRFIGKKARNAECKEYWLDAYQLIFQSYLIVAEDKENMKRADLIDRKGVVSIDEKSTSTVCYSFRINCHTLDVHCIASIGLRCS